MKTIISIIAAIFGSYTFCSATTYYITTAGTNTASGTYAAPWRTLTYAAGNTSPVVAGDTVYVKAGSYGNENVVSTKSGTAGKQIIYQGYTNYPGDSPTLLVYRANPYAAYTTSVMPTYTGSNRNTGIAFDFRDAKFVTLKNFQIEKYSYGLIMGGSGGTEAGRNIVYNVNTQTMGSTVTYDGYGITFGSMSTSFSNWNNISCCLCVNGNAEGITICGDNNLVNRCKVFSNEVSSQTDYYITIVGSYNTVQYCYTMQDPALSSGSHGNITKSNAEQIVDNGLSYAAINPQFNKFICDTSRNISENFSVRHRGSQFNLFYHCYASGTHTGSSGASGDGAGIEPRDGASNNIFDGMRIDSCASGIEFDDTTEDGDTGGSPPGHPGNGNLFINCTISNCYFPVKYSFDGGVASDAGSNTIANCTFYLGRYHIYQARRCSSMVYKNCIFYGNSAVGSGGYFTGGTYTDVVSSQFSYCDFYNIQGGMPGGWSSTGQITTNPTLVNGATRDLRIQSSSPCKNTGAYTTYTTTEPSACQISNPFLNNNAFFDVHKSGARGVAPHITRDYNGKPRDSTPDIGAYEY